MRRRMGGNSPSCFSEEDEGGITLVKGIRLSDGVINRMKRSSEVNSPRLPPEPHAPAPSPLPVQSVEHLPTPPAPPQEARPTPPPVEPAPLINPIPPPPLVKFLSLPSASEESAEQIPPLVSPQTEPPAEPESVPSPPDGESDISPSASTCEPAAASAPPPAEPASLPVDPAPDEAAAWPPQMTPAEPVLSSSVAEEAPPARPELAAASELSSAVAASCWSEKLSVVPSAVKEPNAEEPNITCLPPAEGETPPAAAVLPVCPESVEEELRQKIKVEMQRRLEEELRQKRQTLQQQLEEVRVLAQAAARAQVEQQVNRTLEEEKMKAEDEALMVQLYWMELKAHQLEEKEKQMKQRDVLHKKHVAKQEAKFSDFYKVSVENFQRGKEETHRRFARFNARPVCGHLQAQVLKCYKENPGKTLTCSGIASAYMQCVDNTKKVHITT